MNTLYTLVFLVHSVSQGNGVLQNYNGVFATLEECEAKKQEIVKEVTSDEAKAWLKTNGVDKGRIVCLATQF